MAFKSALENLKNKMLSNPQFQEKFQQAWNTHAAAFGPILEPAFADNMEARTHLVAALNQISRNECEKGLQTLQKLQKHLDTDADKAAYNYFTGLALERSSKQDESIGAYVRANALKHDFYLPYLHVARGAHAEMELAVADENYREAIRCLEKQAQPQSVQLCAVAYSSLAGCLTYMHRYEEAEAMLARSVQLLPQQPGRASIAAMLAAAQGQTERVNEAIAALQSANPQLAEATKMQTDAILSGSSPHFAAYTPDPMDVAAFWEWFGRNEKTLYNLLINKSSNQLSELLQRQLEPLFAPAQQRLSFGVQYDGKVFELNMCDHYSRSVRSILTHMLAQRPENLPDRWAFRIIHSPYAK